MIGIDIVNLERTEKMLKNYPDFLVNGFSKSEREYFEHRGNNPEAIAEALSLKEAALKAVGAENVPDAYCCVEITFSDTGRAEISLIGRPGELLKQKGDVLNCGIIHTENSAIAVVETTA